MAIGSFASGFSSGFSQFVPLIAQKQKEKKLKKEANDFSRDYLLATGQWDKENLSPMLETFNISPQDIEKEAEVRLLASGRISPGQLQQFKQDQELLKTGQALKVWAERYYPPEYQEIFKTLPVEAQVQLFSSYQAADIKAKREAETQANLDDAIQQVTSSPTFSPNVFNPALFSLLQIKHGGFEAAKYAYENMYPESIPAKAGEAKEWEAKRNAAARLAGKPMDTWTNQDRADAQFAFGSLEDAAKVMEFTGDSAMTPKEFMNLRIKLGSGTKFDVKTGVMSTGGPVSVDEAVAFIRESKVAMADISLSDGAQEFARGLAAEALARQVGDRSIDINQVAAMAAKAGIKDPVDKIIQAYVRIVSARGVQ